MIIPLALSIASVSVVVCLIAVHKTAREVALTLLVATVFATIIVCSFIVCRAWLAENGYAEYVLVNSATGKVEWRMKDRIDGPDLWTEGE